MSRRPVKPKRRAETVALAREVGAAEAARRLGLPASTVRSWLHRAGGGSGARSVGAVSSVGAVAGPESVEAVGDPEARGDALELAEQRAARSWSVASRALERAAEAVAVGDSKSARDLAVVVGILTDKAGRIEEGIGALREREVRISEASAQRLAEVLRLVFRGFGIDLSSMSGGRALVGAVLRQASDSQVLSVPLDEAERAERELREHFRREFAREREREQERVGRLALPMPSDEPMVNGMVVSEPESTEPVEAIEEAVVVEGAAPDGLPPGVELAPIEEVTDTFKTIYSDPEEARRAFTLYRHARSDAGKAEVEAKRQAAADHVEAERVAAETAETAARIEKRDAARREQRDRQSRELPRMPKRESPDRGPW